MNPLIRILVDNKKGLKIEPQKLRFKGKMDYTRRQIGKCRGSQDQSLIGVYHDS